jgi:hypothetical protein
VRLDVSGLEHADRHGGAQSCSTAAHVELSCVGVLVCLDLGIYVSGVCVGYVRMCVCVRYASARLAPSMTRALPLAAWTQTTPRCVYACVPSLFPSMRILENVLRQQHLQLPRERGDERCLHLGLQHLTRASGAQPSQSLDTWHKHNARPTH